MQNLYPNQFVGDANSLRDDKLMKRQKYKIPQQKFMCSPRSFVNFWAQVVDNWSESPKPLL